MQLPYVSFVCRVGAAAALRFRNMAVDSRIREDFRSLNIVVFLVLVEYDGRHVNSSEVGHQVLDPKVRSQEQALNQNELM